MVTSETSCGVDFRKEFKSDKETQEALDTLAEDAGKRKTHWSNKFIFRSLQAKNPKAIPNGGKGCFKHTSGDVEVECCAT